MLQVKNLNITHQKDLRVILEDFSCVFNQGDKAVIIGEEGNGKSTLLRWINDPGMIEAYCEANGERILTGEKLAYLPQELPDEDKEKTVYEFFSEEPMFFEQSPKELGKLASTFQLSVEFFYGEQLMKTLSGGEKVKAQLMRLLLTRPTVLLLDEPSNDIDQETLEWMEQMINEWPYVVLFVSHDEILIERTANMIIHLEQIRRKTRSRYTVAHMPYLQYKEERLAQFEKQMRQAISDQKEKKVRDEKYRRIAQSVEHAQETVSRQDPATARLLKKKMHAVKSMERRYEREDEKMTQMPEEESAIGFKWGDQITPIPSGKTVLEYELERLTTPDGLRVLAEEIQLKVRGPEKICIVGHNGVGKTTLLHQIAKKLLERKDIHAEYMPQNYEELLDLEMTPVDYLDQTGEKEERTKIRTYLGSLKYTTDEMEHPISELSGGQKAKVLLLKMNLSGANVLILDEPTRNFSPLSGPVIREMLKTFPGAIISISHDRKFIDEVCNKKYELTSKGLCYLR